MSPILHFVHTTKMPIFQQLQLEEALLRADHRNWCFINHGSLPAIVLGISGNSELLISQPHFKKNPVPVIRRFSGGGTVIIDENTCFISLICKGTDLSIDSCPSQIMKWTESLYQPLFPDHDFKLLDHDYVIGKRKFGGNAQYLCKNRWLHHTSLLWDYNENHMDYLLIPSKMPAYRNNRSHCDFLCRLKDYLPSQEYLFEQLLKGLNQQFTVHQTSLKEALEVLEKPHRKATTFVTL